MDNVVLIKEQIVWYLDPSWWAIFVALLLGVIGVFQEQIKRSFWKPKLVIGFNLEPPDSHKTKLTNRITGDFICNTYYLRAKIKNDGNFQAEDIEVMASELYKKGKNGRFIKDKSFLPLNLKWSHTGEITKEKIQPGLFKYLDFGHLLPSEGSSKNKIVLELDVEMKPNTGSHLIPPGEYRITLLIAANNTKLINKQFLLILKNDWRDDEGEMFNKIVVLSPIS